MEDQTVPQTISGYAIEKGISDEQATVELLTHGFIEPITLTFQPLQGFPVENETYGLTSKGREAFSKYGSFVEYLKAQIEKDERDEKTKDAQLQKLEAELLVLKDMQAEQRTFWQSGIDRDKRQKWQFWLTLLLAAGGFVLGIINFVKSIVLPK